MFGAAAVAILFARERAAAIISWTSFELSLSAGGWFGVVVVFAGAIPTAGDVTDLLARGPLLVLVKLTQ